MSFGFPTSRHGAEFANDPEETADEQFARMQAVAREQAQAAQAERQRRLNTRAEYPSGMVRSASAGRPRFDLLYPENIPYADQFLTRMAQRLADGAKDYGDRNWERSNSTAEIARAKESAGRHFAAWMAGDPHEDHAAALAVNLLFAESIAYRVSHQANASFGALIRRAMEKR